MQIPFPLPVLPYHIHIQQRYGKGRAQYTNKVDACSYIIRGHKHRKKTSQQLIEGGSGGMVYLQSITDSYKFAGVPKAGGGSHGEPVQNQSCNKCKETQDAIRRSMIREHTCLSDMYNG